MLNNLFIRYRQREVEERPRGATRADPGAAQIWRHALSQVARSVPWPHLGMALAVALAAGSIPWLSGLALDAVDREITGIAVEGDLRGVQRAELDRRLEPWLGRSYFASDLEDIKAAVEQEPWVDTAAVRRVWPGGLNVEVVEHVPVAFWNGNKLMTRTGEVISPDSVAAAGNLPQLSGPPKRASEVLDTAQRISARLVQEDLRLAGLSQEARGAWTLQLDNGISVELGRDRIDQRLERFLAVYSSHLKTRVSEVAGVDARYSNGIAVSWKDDGQEQI